MLSNQPPPEIKEQTQLGPLLVARLAPDETDEQTNNKRKNAFATLNGFAKQLGFRERIAFIKTCVTTLGLEQQLNRHMQDSRSYQGMCAQFETLYQEYQQEENEIRAVWNETELSLREQLKKIDAIRKKYKNTTKEPGKSFQQAKSQLKKLLNTFHQALNGVIDEKPIGYNEQWTTIIKQVTTVPMNMEHGLSDIPSIQCGQSIWTANVPTVPEQIAPGNKAALLPYLSKQMTDYRCISPKRGGANNPGEYGGNYLGFYKDAEGNLQTQMVFFKQATDEEINHRENMAEVLSGNIMRSVVGNNSAATLFANKPVKDNEQANRDTATYVGSIFYDEFKDLTSLKSDLRYTYHGLHKVHEFTPDPAMKREKGTDASLRMQMTTRLLAYGGYALKEDAKEDKDFLNHKKPIPGLGKVLGSSLLVGNTQFHTDNTAIAKVGDRYEFVGIDFGGAFRRRFAGFNTKAKAVESDDEPFARSIHPHNVTQRKQYTHYIDSYPIDVRMSAQFVEELNGIAMSSKSALKKTIEDAIDEALEHYNQETLITQFALELDPDEKILALSKIAKENQPNELKTFLVDRILSRQFSLGEYAMELTLSAWAERERLKKKLDANQTLTETEKMYQPHLANPMNNHHEELTKLFHQHPMYFMASHYHFRGPALDTNSEPYFSELKKQFQEEMQSDHLTDIEALLANDLKILTFLSSRKREERLKHITTCMLARLNMMRTILDYFEVKEEDHAKAERDTLIAYLTNALTDNALFSNPTDSQLVIQACDSAYNEVIRSYHLCVAQRKGMEATVLNALSIAGDPSSLPEQRSYVQSIAALSDPKMMKQRLEQIVKQDPFSLGNILLRQLEKPESHEQALNSFKEILSLLGNPSKKRALSAIATAFHLPDSDIDSLFTLLKEKRYTNRNTWENVLRCIPRDTLNHTDLFSRPLSQVQSDKPRHEELRQGMSRNIQDYRYLAPKGAGGAQDSGPLGGWYMGCYQTPDGKIHAQRFMIKREGKPCKNIIESLCGRIKSSFVNLDADYSAGTFMVKDPYAKATGSTNYAVSIAFDAYQESHKLAGFNERVKLAGSRQELPLETKATAVFEKISSLHDESGYKGLEEALIAAWLTGDDDVHSANIGVGKQQFLSIDHAGGLLHLDNHIHPHRYGIWNFWRVLHLEPTFHAHEYPTVLRVNHQMAEAIAKCTTRMTYTQLEQLVQDEITSACDNYKEDPKVLKQLAKRIGIPKSKLVTAGNTVQDYADLIKGFLPNTLFLRMQSLKQYGLEIELSLCFSYDKKQGFYLSDPKKLNDFIHQHPHFCLQEQHHFRGKSNGKRRGGWLYHWFGNRFSRSARQLDQLVYEKTSEIFSNEQPFGIRKLLMKDFDPKHTLPERATIYAARLKIILAILKINKVRDFPFTERMQEQIRFLQEFAYKMQYDPNSRVDQNHLIQFCDTAFNTIVHTFDTMPLDLSKLHIYELFNSINSNPEAIHLFEQEPIKTVQTKLSGFTINEAALTKAIQEASANLMNVSQSAPYRNNKAEETHATEQIKQAVESLKRLATALQEPTENSRLSHITQGVEKTQHLMTADPDKQFFSTRVTCINRQQGTSFAEEATQFFSTNRTQAEDKPIAGAIAEIKAPLPLEQVAPFADDKTAVILIHPWSEDPINQAKSGSLLTSENQVTTLTDYEDPDLSIAHTLALLLIRHWENPTNAPDTDRLKKLEAYLTTHYVAKIQRYPAEFVTEKNLNELLSSRDFKAAFPLSLPKETSGFGIFGKTRMSASTFSRHIYNQYASALKWNPKLIALAHIWFDTLMKDPSITIHNIVLKNSGGNSEFTRLVLIYARYKGARLDAHQNRTGYTISDNEMNAGVKRMAEIFDPVSQQTNHTLRNEVMRYLPADLHQPAIQEASTLLSNELNIWIQKTAVEVDTFDFTKLDQAATETALTRLRNEMNFLSSHPAVYTIHKVLGHKLSEKIEEGQTHLRKFHKPTEVKS